MPQISSAKLYITGFEPRSSAEQPDALSIALLPSLT